MVLGADDTVARRPGRKINANGCEREAVRSTKKHVSRCFGRQGVAMRLLVPGPWRRRVWALPWLSAVCRPAEQARRRRHKTRVAGVRQMRNQARRWLPGRRLVVVGAGGVAAIALALAWVTPPVVRVARLRWEAARSHPPAPRPPGKPGPKPSTGKRQRCWQGWAARSDTPGERVEVEWYGGQPNTLWVVSRTALWYT